MFNDFREDIQSRKIDYNYIALMSSKLRVGIIGGGKVAYLKAKTFISNGCFLEIISKEFSKEFLELDYKNIVLNNKKYYKDFINDKHIIIIAIDDDKLRKEITNDCDSLFKIYIDCTDVRNGVAAMPIQRKTKNISVALNTSFSNPKASKMLIESVVKNLSEYDDFIEYVGKIRNNAKGLEVYKKEIIEFVNSEDFKFIWEKNKSEMILKMFFDEDIIKRLKE